MIRILLVPLLLWPAATMAQVSVNAGALDQLKPSAPAANAAVPQRRPAAHPVARRAPARRQTPPASAKPPVNAGRTAAKPAPARPVTIAPAPPASPVLPPAVPTQQAAPPAPPPPVPVVPDAGGSYAVLPGGVRVIFAPGKTDLNAPMIDSIRAIAGQLKTDAAADVSIYAYAAGVTDDPSTPRRLSLSRALAARAILINEGIASTRIYPRALGVAPDGPPDRVDVVRSGFPVPGGETPK